MNKETIKEIMYILIAITLGVIAVKFVIWLLPFILIGVCSYFFYKSITKNKKSTSKNKRIKIIDIKDED